MTLIAVGQVEELANADVHHLPCNVAYSGDAAGAEDYFGSNVKDVDGLTNSFRGHKLKGAVVAGESSHHNSRQVLILRDEGSQHDGEKVLRAVARTGTRKEDGSATYWNHDDKAAEDLDQIAISTRWLEVAQALHGDGFVDKVDQTSQSAQ